MSVAEEKVYITPEWDSVLHDEFAKPYFIALQEKVHCAYMERTVFPEQQNIFRAFDLCAPKEVHVVILGQDPYHTPSVADGLAFSTKEGNPLPPSLQNVYKEIAIEFDSPLRANPDLSDWAKQGVLLLNASLTVESGKANSHVEFGWHEFTDAIIRILSERQEHVVFMLWGNYAREKRVLIDPSKHLILESPHPSPLSAPKGFFGNGHFKKANAYLEQSGREGIRW